MAANCPPPLPCPEGQGSLSQRGAMNCGPSAAPPGQAARAPRALSLLNGADGLPHSGPELRPRCRETAWVPTSSFTLGVKLVVREVRPVCMAAVGPELMCPLEFGVMFGSPPYVSGL